MNEVVMVTLKGSKPSAIPDREGGLDELTNTGIEFLRCTISKIHHWI